MYVYSAAVRCVAGAPSAATTSARVIPGETVRSDCCANSAEGRASKARAMDRRMRRSSSGGDALKNGFEERETIGGTQQRVHGALRMGHHAEHVALLTDDSGDVSHRTIGIVRFGGLQTVG